MELIDKKNRVVVIAFVLLVGVLGLGECARAEVFISDHFNDQSDWVGCSGAPCTGANCIDPPSPWSSYGYYCSSDIHISSIDDAHGAGKCMWIEWPVAMAGRALMTYAAQGGSDYWVGFWWRHNAGWDWGGDTTHKWFYGPTSSGDRWMMNYDQNHRVVMGIGEDYSIMRSDVTFDINDDSWHYYIIYYKHNTVGNYDGEIRLWVDGVEALWNVYFGPMHSNTEIRFDPDTSIWDTPCFIAFGFQSRPDWGAGNKVYWDDIIVASTKKEVEEFLNATLIDAKPPTRSNPQPTGTLSLGTTTANISLSTNVQAICRYTNTSNTNYTDMPFNFTYTNSTKHSTPVADLENGKSYTFYVRCNSSYGYVNTDDFNISFSIDGHKADLNEDGVISMKELMAYIARWKAGNGVTKAEVLDAKNIWFAGWVY